MADNRHIGDDSELDKCYGCGDLSIDRVQSGVGLLATELLAHVLIVSTPDQLLIDVGERMHCMSLSLTAPSVYVTH